MIERVSLTPSFSLQLLQLQVGPTYGRKMVAGYLRQKHGERTFGEGRFGTILARVNPRNHCRRRTNTSRLINPITYRADYFGHTSF